MLLLLSLHPSSASRTANREPGPAKCERAAAEGDGLCAGLTSNTSVRTHRSSSQSSVNDSGELDFNIASVSPILRFKPDDSRSSGPRSMGTPRVSRRASYSSSPSPSLRASRQSTLSARGSGGSSSSSSADCAKSLAGSAGPAAPSTSILSTHFLFSRSGEPPVLSMLVMRDRFLTSLVLDEAWFWRHASTLPPAMASSAWSSNRSAGSTRSSRRTCTSGPSARPTSSPSSSRRSVAR